MITIDDFIEKFADAIEVEDADTIKPETEFRSLDEWNSLAFLSVIALLDEEFGIQIEEAEFKEINTVTELFQKCTK